MCPGEVTTPAATKITATAASAITDAPMEQQGSDSKFFISIILSPWLSFSFLSKAVQEEEPRFSVYWFVLFHQ